MCRLCDTGKRIADLNGYCEKCWDNVFGHPSWKDENYPITYTTIDENGKIVPAFVRIGDEFHAIDETEKPLDEIEIEHFMLIDEPRY